MWHALSDRLLTMEGRKKETKRQQVVEQERK